jgi:uncharacterized damage-inducible protein DinB
LDLVTHLARQLRYGGWANEAVLRSLRAAEAPSAKAIDLFAHVLGAERLWLDRIASAGAPLPLWPDFTVEECERELAALERSWQALLSGLDPAKLAEPVSYVNSKGEPWTSTVLDILQHIVLHGSYHRGQIAAAIRSGGDMPPYTDFIHCVRQGLV